LTIELIMINFNHSFLPEIVKTFLASNISEPSTLILGQVSLLTGFPCAERTKIEVASYGYCTDRLRRFGGRYGVTD